MDGNSVTSPSKPDEMPKEAFNKPYSGDAEKQSVSTESDTALPAAPTLVSPMHPSQFPDGGLRAWLCVAGGFCCAFCSFGWVNAIGVFQEYYQNELLQGYSPSSISWIVSLETFCMFLGAPVVGKLYDNYGPRRVLVAGTLMHVFGLMMASLSTKYYQLLLSQGICSPLGASAVLYPAMSATITWFHKNRALALGIMTSGSSLGGVLFPIMVQRLIPEAGFPWAMRASAFLILGMLSFACISVTSRIPPAPKPLSIMEFISPFSEPPYAGICAASFFGFLGLFIPFNYITLSALSVGMSKNISNYVIPILNAGSIFGRIFPGWAADHFGRFNMQIAMCSVSFIITLGLWLPATGNAPIIVYALLYGFSSGTFVSLASPLIAQITTDMRTMGVRTGTYFFVVSFASLIGNPIAGALLSRDNFGFQYLQIFTGISIAVSVGLFIYTKSLCKGSFLKKF